MRWTKKVAPGLRQLSVVVILATLIQLLHALGVFHDSQVGIYQFLVNLHEVDPSTQVCLVGITDDDRADLTLFKDGRTLDPAGIERIIAAVHATGPTCVVVDIFLQPDPYESADWQTRREQLLQTIIGYGEQGESLWILVAEERADNQRASSADSLWSVIRDMSTEPGTSILLATSAVAPKQIRQGIVPLRVEGPLTPLGRFAENLSADSSNELHDEFRIHFSGAFGDGLPGRWKVFFTAKEVLSGIRELPFSNRTVVIGGTFKDSADEVATPIGILPGCELWAEAIDAWIRHDSLPENTILASWLTDVFVGLGLVVIFHLFGLMLGAAVGGLAVASAGFFAAVSSYDHGWLLMELTPMLVGVFAHHYYELAHSRREHGSVLRIRWKEGREKRRQDLH